MYFFGIYMSSCLEYQPRSDCTRFTGNLYIPDRESQDIVMLNLNTIGMCNLWTRGIKPAAENGGCSNHNQQCRIRCKLTENGELTNIHVNIPQTMSINHNHALIVRGSLNALFNMR